MTNAELTLDQLQTINAGAAFMKLGDIKGEYRRIIQSNFRNRIGDAANGFQPREVSALEIGRPPDPKLWLQMYG